MSKKIEICDLSNETKPIRYLNLKHVSEKMGMTPDSIILMSYWRVMPGPKNIGCDKIGWDEVEILEWQRQLTAAYCNSDDPAVLDAVIVECLKNQRKCRKITASEQSVNCGKGTQNAVSSK